MRTLTINGIPSTLASTRPASKPLPILTHYRVEWSYGDRPCHHNLIGLEKAKDHIDRLSRCPYVSNLTLYVRIGGTWVERPLPTLPSQERPLPTI